ncbi:pentatricopeptide repeat-containing protein At1g63330-like [Lycium ferocissimum]|uniref:pentatricopeptide repeat-containing protein At1g63330-like n=1 Tax=Lycium ferocissimum TaxID=112874 RepID=UPI0028156D10|nr:pentatricopeptide repeat-containing protein At1g63330-like [Lycium ferocissimum]
MGFELLPKKSSFNLILRGLHELGFYKRQFFVKKRNFCRKYFAASSVELLEDSCSSSNGESSMENEEVFVTYSCREKKLLSVVTRICKSLSWKVAKELPFRSSMKKYGFTHSINGFRMIIHTFAFAGMRLEVYALLKDIVFYFLEAGFDLYKIFHLFTTESVFVADVLIKLFAANKMLDCAIDVVKQARKIGLEPGIFSCNFLLKCLVEANMKEHVLNLFEEMKNFGPLPDLRTYTILMNFYCSYHIDIEVAQKILEEMQKRQISPSVVTYSTYIHGLCRVGEADFALRSVRYLRDNNEPLNCYCYNAIIRRFCATGEVSRAISIFDEMKSWGIIPDLCSYSILIDGLCKCLNLEKAINLIEEMKANNIKPTIVTYTSLLNGFCKIGAMEIAIKTFYELENSGYKFDQLAYSILINGFCAQGNLTSAYKLLVEMINKKLAPDTSHYKRLIRCFCQMDSSNKVEYLSMMVQEGYLPDSITCDFMVNWYCTEGRLAEALQLIDKMVNQGITSNKYAYNVVINRLCKDRKPEKAMEVIPIMLKRNTLHAASWNTLIDGFAKKSDSKKAYMLHEKMQKLGINPDIITWTILANILCMTGQVGKANELLRDMIMMGLNPDTISYTSMIAGFCKNGYVNEAFKLFKKMPCMPSVVTYNCLINGCCQVNSIDQALILYRRMQKVGVTPDIITCTILINALCKRSKVSEAFELFKEMPSKMSSVVTYSCLIDGFCKEGRMDRAEMLLDEMRIQNVSPDAITYYIMICGYKRRGQLDLAYDIFYEMIDEGILPDVFFKTLGLKQIG